MFRKLTARLYGLASIGLFSALLIACSSDSSTAGGASSSSSSSSSSSGGSGPVGDAQRGASLFAQQCVNCHNTQVLGLSPYTLESLALVIQNTMPVGNATACGAECALDIATFISIDNPNFGKDPSQIGERFDNLEAPTGQVDPAPVVINRLNRTQYNNTVRDLLGTTQTPADTFPEDNRGGVGQYDTIAGSHSVALIHMEQYVAAAQSLAQEVIAGKLNAPVVRVQAETQQLSGSTQVQGTFVNLFAGNSLLTIPFSGAGDYRITVRAGQEIGGDQAAHMLVTVNGIEIGSTYVPTAHRAFDTYRFETQLGDDNHVMEISFTNDFYDGPGDDRNLLVDWVEFENQSWSTAGQTAIPCDIDAGIDCALQVINTFAPRAWRRPLAESERSNLESLFLQAQQIAGDDTFAFEQLIRGIILSPNFMYRPEVDPDPNSTQPRLLDAYELASRLSYFLWNSMPDQALFDAAANGSLLNESTLRQQVQRMLQDPKATEALVEGFLVQWLKVDLASAPSAQHFPDFGPELTHLMRRETRLLLTELFESNAPITQIVEADFTYLNGALANHYGVSGISGESFVRHQWNGVERRGILGQGSFLTATAHPVVTSPVLRGAYILANLICKEPPPPPQGVDTEIRIDANLSTREMAELHRDSGSSCFGCHSLMDPLGFGLENFDSAGQWRWVDGQHTVDASGTLPGGVQFNGPVQLSEVLRDSPRLPMCVIDHLMTYGIGRGLEAFHDGASGQEPAGYATVFDVYLKSAARGHRIHAMIEEVILSPAFRMRRGANSAP